MVGLIGRTTAGTGWAIISVALLFVADAFRLRRFEEGRRVAESVESSPVRLGPMGSS
jgi:hypothetical protein